MAKILQGSSLPMQNIDKSLGEIYFEALKFPTNPLKDVLIDAIGNVSFTVAECFQQTILVASTLHKLGVGKGDIIGIIAANRVDYAFISTACFYLGATIHPLNPEYKSLEIIHAFTITKPKVVIVAAENLKETQEAIKDVTFVETVLRFEDLHEENEYSEEELNEIEANLPLAKGSSMSDEVAIILNSAGTTGFPKGVSITQFAFKNILCMFASEECGVGFEYNSTMHAILPFYHMFGFVTLMACLQLNARAIVLRKFKPAIYLETIQTYRISTLFLVPPIVLFLAKDALTEQFDLSSITNVICGGSPLVPETQSAFEDKFGWQLRQVYGMTETAMISLVPAQGVRVQGSIGKVVPNTQVKITDIETQAVLGTNEVGEICAKGPSMIKEYFGNKAATEAIFDSDGFLHTGDIGYFNTEEFLFVEGRLKELIKYKGLQIAPAEIEDILMKHAGIVDAAVIGVKDERAGEVPKAFIVRAPESPLTEEEVKKFIAEHVTFHKQLHGGVEFVATIPRSPVGKILRRQLH